MTTAGAALPDPLSQIMALLPAELGQWLVAKLETPRQRQARTLDERDARGLAAAAVKREATRASKGRRR